LAPLRNPDGALGKRRVGGRTVIGCGAAMGRRKATQRRTGAKLTVEAVGLR
jgi:hypothetical protein